MTTAVVKKILFRISKIEAELQLLKKNLIEEENDDWLYEKPVVTLLKKRVKEAQKEFAQGKTITSEELRKELNNFTIIRRVYSYEK